MCFRKNNFKSFFIVVVFIFIKDELKGTENENLVTNIEQKDLISIVNRYWLNSRKDKKKFLYIFKFDNRIGINQEITVQDKEEYKIKIIEKENKNYELLINDSEEILHTW